MIDAEQWAGAFEDVDREDDEREELSEDEGAPGADDFEPVPIEIEAAHLWAAWLRRGPQSAAGYWHFETEAELLDSVAEYCREWCLPASGLREFRGTREQVRAAVIDCYEWRAALIARIRARRGLR